MDELTPLTYRDFIGIAAVVLAIVVSLAGACVVLAERT